MKKYTRFICTYGKLHPLSEECNCQVKYNMSPSMFETRLMKLFPLKRAINLTFSEFKTIVEPVVHSNHN